MDYTVWDSSGQNTGVGGHFLLQGIFPTHGLNQGPLHCRWTLYPLSYEGSPKGKTVAASAGNRTSVVGKNSTTEPPVYHID